MAWMECYDYGHLGRRPLQLSFKISSTSTGFHRRPSDVLFQEKKDKYAIDHQPAQWQSSWPLLAAFTCIHDILNSDTFCGKPTLVCRRLCRLIMPYSINSSNFAAVTSQNGRRPIPNVPSLTTLAAVSWRLTVQSNSCTNPGQSRPWSARMGKPSTMVATADRS